MQTTEMTTKTTSTNLTSLYTDYKTVEKQLNKIKYKLIKEAKHDKLKFKQVGLYGCEDVTVCNVTSSNFQMKDEGSTERSIEFFSYNQIVEIEVIKLLNEIILYFK